MRYVTVLAKAKKFAFTKNGFFYAYKIDEYDKELSHSEFIKLISKIKKDSSFKKAYVDSKRCSYKTGLNKWLKIVNPSEYICMTRDEPSYHNDSFEILYKI